MLTKVKIPLDYGNLTMGYQIFWSHDACGFSEDEILGTVTAEELLANPAAAAEDYCGENLTIRTLDDVIGFVGHLVETHDYPLHVVLQCAAKLVLLHAE